MKSAPAKPLFLRACYGEPVERTPIWVMRQAGRYLPAYQAVRAKVDFQTLYKTPALASAVTVQPVEILGFDAAILFSDILVIPEAMGMKLDRPYTKLPTGIANAYVTDPWGTNIELTEGLNRL